MRDINIDKIIQMNNKSKMRKSSINKQMRRRDSERWNMKCIITL